MAIRVAKMLARLLHAFIPGDTGTLVLDGRNGGEDPSSVQDLAATAGSGTRILGIYPNPAVGDFQIRFSLTRPASVRFELVDASGRVVAEHQAGSYGAGEWEFSWPDRNEDDGLGAGVYFLRLSSGDRQETVQKLIILR